MKKKMIIDIVMVLLLPCLMAYSLVGETLHEWIGIGMFALFIAHHVLNRFWLLNLRRGPYNLLRTVNTAVDLLLFIDMLCLMVSAVLISKHVFAFLGISAGASIGRVLHMLAAYWGFVLMSLHLGMHAGMIRLQMKIDKKPVLDRALWLLFTAAALYGLTAFIKRGMLSYLFARQLFVFIDPDEPLILCLLDHLAIMVFFAKIAHIAFRVIRIVQQRKTELQKAQKAEGADQKTGTDRKIQSGEGPEKDGVPDPETEKKKQKKKRRRIILAVLGVVLLIAVLVWGIPYTRRHFVTVRIDRAQATAIAPVDLGGKTLIVYFSRTGNSNFEPDVDAVSSASLMLDENGQLVGNAELLAEMVQKATGGDVHAIRVAEENRYPSTYGDTVSVAGDELKAADLPKLDEAVGLPDTAAYDNIILIYPIWWWTVPKPVEAWLAQVDLNGREVYLVVTHGGSGAGNCPKDMMSMLRGGTVNENVLTVYDDDADEAADQVYAWLKSLK